MTFMPFYTYNRLKPISIDLQGKLLFMGSSPFFEGDIMLNQLE
jgi:hypothetical protein